MTSKTLNYYQIELQERAKQAKWERRSAALCALLLVLIVGGILFLVAKNAEIFPVQAEVRGDQIGLLELTRGTSELPPF